MDNTTYLVSNLCTAMICGVLGICLRVVPFARHEGIGNYVFSRKVLAWGYIIFAILILCILIFSISDNSKEIIPISALIISSLQALIFTFALISLINPRFDYKTFVKKQLLVFCIILIVYMIGMFFEGDLVISNTKIYITHFFHLPVLARTIFLLFYLYQLVYFTKVFFREERKYKKTLYNYFSEVLEIKLTWIRYVFVLALCIGVLSVVFTFLPGKTTDLIFLSLVVSVYMYTAIKYIDYSSVFEVVNVVTQPEEPTQGVSEKNSTLHQRFCQKIIGEKFYCKREVNINDMAMLLLTNRTYLSKYINQTYGMNFSSLINQLRVEDAKKILFEQPELPIFIIAMQLGYADTSHFCKQFKHISGISPSGWKSKIESQKQIQSI